MVRKAILSAAVVLLVALLARFSGDDQRCTYWWTEIDHGCKPSMGLLLKERDGALIYCSFFLLVPNDGSDEARQGMQFPAAIRARASQRYEIDVDLAPAGSKERFSLQIHGCRASGKLAGEIASGLGPTAVAETVAFRSVDESIMRPYLRDP
ncbi:MAG: hypothetical protein HYS13_00750 [Planctomycetia bacterium]|nr:hypothetical protein [Planctomycetia bacterium]